MKLPLYAGAGIVEVWIVDLAEETVDVFRDPPAERYRTETRFRASDETSPRAFPRITLRAGDLFN